MRWTGNPGGLLVVAGGVVTALGGLLGIVDAAVASGWTARWGTDLAWLASGAGLVVIGLLLTARDHGIPLVLVLLGGLALAAYGAVVETPPAILGGGLVAAGSWATGRWDRRAPWM